MSGFETVAADATYMSSRYGPEAAQLLWSVGQTDLQYMRQRELFAEIFTIAVDFRILYGADTLIGEEHDTVRDLQADIIDGALNDGRDYVAATEAAKYRFFFGNKHWVEQEDKRMFDACEANIARMLVDGPGSGWHIYGLNEPLVALRALSGKSYAMANPEIGSHISQVSRGVYSRLAWSTDWRDVAQAAQIRVLDAQSLAYTEHGVVIQD